MSERVVPEGSRQRRRPTKQGAVLSEQLIVETALRLVAQHGADALSVRRLGAALGADPSALYRYFRNTDALLLAIADELIGRAQDGWTATGNWRTDLRSMGLRIHAIYVAHPQAAVLGAYRTTGRPHETRAVERILGILRSAGFPDALAVRIYHAFVDQALAFAAQDAAAKALPPAAREGDEQVWQSVYGRLSPDTHPNIAATFPLLAADMRESGYPFALDLTLGAAAALLSQEAPRA
ncbi:TetR/AcrR family transcriptional regulator [Streptomyces gardneri]|uniref:TetR/AcrR family transcriptional regulator n=1 Tax=Streptomyces gardneri TaxID=66892 RepID=UPI0006BCB97B|nr:TetR/AcrR family transcriptional regulator [Streptomyces gardneri]QPK49638.1 TetR/AcrR family transcriptional regulator [Streptomyces gardneri]WRK41190.1 TetR/AcrR family transcriptional regulator [Streptomyces venezuelae]CUM36392.1 tetR-family transcriptional regulator [Streptomyces venezuelae]